MADTCNETPRKASPPEADRSTARSQRVSRKKPTKSYRVQDQYAFLDKDSDDESGDGSTDPTNNAALDEDEGDDFVPTGPDEQEDPDELMEYEPFHEDSEELEEQLQNEGLNEVSSASEADFEIETDRQKRLRIDSSEVPISAASAGVGMRTIKPFAKSQGTRVRNMGVGHLHSRGVDDWARRGGLEVRLKDLFGPSHTDLTSVFMTRDQWASQETLPSRKAGSLRRSFYVKEEAIQEEKKMIRNWYSEQGSRMFDNGQVSKQLSEEDSRAYLSNDGPNSLNILLGTLSNKQMYTLDKGSSINTADPFTNKENRRGWIINLGSKITGTEWAPNEEGSTQYLAIAAEQTAKPPHDTMENSRAPAFNATRPFLASIQIWAFGSTENGDLDALQRPRLELVMCTDWGSPKQFKWCPLRVAKLSDNGGVVHIGLLACVWSDGKVRLLDISLRRVPGTPFQTKYVQYSKAAFEVQLPDTVPTCVRWLSAASFAVGTAAGTVAIWTMTKRSSSHSAQVPPDKFVTQPWFYRQVADTYILTLESGYPSLPSYISITSADGFGKLYDLRSPGADYVSSARGRIFATAQAWHEHTQSFLMPDENYLFRNNTVRRYYTNIYSMRVESQIVCCATSPVQPGVLIGCADGLVTSSNPVLKVINSKEIPWQQIWFTHEWRPPVGDALSRGKGTDNGPEHASRQDTLDEAEITAENPIRDPKPTIENAAPMSNQGQSTSISSQEPKKGTPFELLEPIPTNTGVTKSSPDVLSQPLARFNEGYRVQQINMAYYKPSKGRVDSKEAIKYITIYEEPSAVTSLAWNPNLKYGTWAVAGMGDGLVRVEDLGV